ncbi:MAG TPA: F420-nonreducing hydrogenase [Patescibacteria group bacterium]|nr:F420-nonreducing hydrogenase [Patescibacteria group bacterium]
MVKLLLAGLSGDSGCQVAALALHDKLLDIILANELVYAPTLIDAKVIPDDVDAAIIEGGIRTEHEKEIAEEIRRKSKAVITIGSCACFGGIPGLANLKGGGELLKNVYADLEGTVAGPIPEHTVVTEQMMPVSSVVKVDFMIPGCPPEVTDIAYFLTTLLKGEVPELSKTDVCDDCPKERTGEYAETFKRIHEEIPDPDRCLLEQGYICMGPATRGGCGAPCPTAGVTCDGCRGPTDRSDDQGLTMLDALMSLAGTLKDEFSLPQHMGYIYRYSYASSKLAKILRRDGNE